MLRCREIDGDKGQPHDTSRIHGEPNKFRFIERLWDFPRQHSINCANNNQEYWVRERYHVVSVNRCLKIRMCKRKQSIGYGQ